ncbi:MAG: DNA alkylation repair protein, partial [Cyclobacteriaceae bacterium]
MKSSADPKRAAGMKAYMRNQFDFFGISSPERKMIFRPFLLNLDKRDHPKDDFIMSCYGDDHRECQYLAMEYLF